VLSIKAAQEKEQTTQVTKEKFNFLFSLQGESFHFGNEP